MNISKIRAVIATTAFIALLSFQNVRADAITEALAAPTAVATPTAVVTPAAVVTPEAVVTPTAVATPTPPPPLKVVDLVFFMGQSNMSGRGGNAKAAPGVPTDKGYEFRIGTCPTGLYPITEPFGIYSNGYLCDPPVLRGGSLVSSFANSYYKGCGVPVMGFSAARGGTSIGYWQGANVQQELSTKYDTIKAWCAANNVSIRRTYAVWLQGETDGVGHITKSAYKTGLANVFRGMFAKGLEQVFVITIGQYGGLPGTYDEVAAAQIELCTEDPHFTLGSSALRTLPDSYLTDGCHYNQAALNIVGAQCGSAAAARSNLIH